MNTETIILIAIAIGFVILSGFIARRGAKQEESWQSFKTKKEKRKAFCIAFWLRFFAWIIVAVIVFLIIAFSISFHFF